MPKGGFRFDRFHLDPDQRRLTLDGATVDLNSRYFDALVLLVREAGGLVTKDRFLAEVWRGVPVTDEALTQCVRTLRRALGDDAARPRFIETAPGHGYRFIATVREATADTAGPDAAAAAAGYSWRRFLIRGEAAAIGGAVAGILGGAVYGLIGALGSDGARMGAGSVIMALVSITALTGLVGGAGVGFGVSAAGFAARRRGLWSVAGGGLGGLIVGAVVKLLGLDAFNLLFGQSPAGITGAPEGALLGAAVGLAAWLAAGDAPRLSPRRGLATAGGIGGLAGLLIALMGGRLMIGSLDVLARQFPQSHLGLDAIARLFGEAGFGPVTRVATAGMEGALFAACVTGAMMMARRAGGA